MASIQPATDDLKIVGVVIVGIAIDVTIVRCDGVDVDGTTDVLRSGALTHIYFLLAARRFMTYPATTAPTAAAKTIPMMMAFPAPPVCGASPSRSLISEASPVSSGGSGAAGICAEARTLVGVGVGDGGCCDVAGVEVKTGEAVGETIGVGSLAPSVALDSSGSGTAVASGVGAAVVIDTCPPVRRLNLGRTSNSRISLSMRTL